MMGQIESYFHKEITLALERQGCFSEGFRFVLPAILAPCTGLDKLAAWNATDLTAPQGIQDLAEAKKRLSKRTCTLLAALEMIPR